MTDELPENLLYEGLTVEFSFAEPRPSFGDLFRICGEKHPRFPPTGEYGFERLDDLQFNQVDDYFGVRTQSGEGDDVGVWLYPLVDGQVVDHHPGPFDAVRLEYDILRNPVDRFEHFVKCVTGYASLGFTGTYRAIPLGSPPDIAAIRDDFDAVVRHWAGRKIKVGSAKALRIDF